MASEDIDWVLTKLRRRVAEYGSLMEGGKGADSELADLAHEFAGLVAELDDHLSAGGNPPEAWREGPDAVPARDDDYTPEGMDRTDVATADEARQAAMEWQARSADRGMSYGELAEWQGYFAQLGERFGLTAEFRENGII